MKRRKRIPLWKCFFFLKPLVAALRWNKINKLFHAPKNTVFRFTEANEFNWSDMALCAQTWLNMIKLFFIICVLGYSYHYHDVLRRRCCLLSRSRSSLSITHFHSYAFSSCRRFVRNRSDNRRTLTCVAYTHQPVRPPVDRANQHFQVQRIKNTNWLEKIFDIFLFVCRCLLVIASNHQVTVSSCPV